MKYGFYLPTRGPLAEPDAIATIVREGESMGFSSIVIGDHVVFPVAVESTYPYTVDGGFPGHGDAMEQLSIMAFIAGVSSTSTTMKPHEPITTTTTKPNPTTTNDNDNT